MDNIELLRRRLHNQHLTRPGASSPAAEVAWLGAVQAQDYAGAKWALGQRVQGATDEALERAFTAGEILRTHVLRPTWHFVAPADIRWLLALTGPRVLAATAYYHRMQGLDAALFKRSNAAIARALRGANYLTRAELNKVLRLAGIERDLLGLTFLVMRAELDAIICSGPRRGKQFTYALLEERVPAARSLEPDEALAELAKRYFTSHGPATVQDFVWWSGLAAAQARRSIALLGSALEHALVEGKEHWFKDTPPLPFSRAASLLPSYDEYTVAYKDRSAFYPAHLIENNAARENSPFSQTIIMRGRIIGMWQRILKKDSILIAPRFVAPAAPAAQRAFTAAARRLGAFLGLALSVA